MYIICKQDLISSMSLFILCLWLEDTNLTLNRSEIEITTERTTPSPYFQSCLFVHSIQVKRDGKVTS